MSLINKMLQDLDARGVQGGAPAQGDVKPVLRDERNVPLPLVIGGVAGAAVLAVAGVFGWRWWQRPAAVPAAPLVVAPVVTAPAPLVAAPVAPLVPSPAPVPESNHEAPVAKPAPKPVEKKVAAPVVKTVPAERTSVAAVEPASVRRQAPEDQYRRALSDLQEGRVPEAIAQLEQTLRQDPRHEAARQTLVGLLIENRRADEAMRVLQAGLALDARQPSLAMLLARLQIEHGASGVDTLLRSLPAAGGDADYHAFLAGALQRDQRHREAAEQYIAALRASPDNGVWLMGLGICLQADKRPAEALDAFQRAKASASLSPELQAFVDRKISQLK